MVSNVTLQLMVKLMNTSSRVCVFVLFWCIHVRWQHEALTLPTWSTLLTLTYLVI